MRTSYRWYAGCFLVVTIALAGYVRAQGNPYAIVEAARADDVSAVRSLLDQGVDVDASQADGATALLWAAYHSDLLMARLLIDAGIDVDAGNSVGVTPLVQAASTGDAAMVEALIGAGADPNLGPEESTALMEASRAGSVEAVRLLLAAGADVNATEAWEGQTALMWASGEGHADVVRTLLEAGADPDVVAAETQLTNRSHADHPSGGLTAVMFAARGGHTDAVRALVAGGADLSHANPDNVTALVIAIVNDRFDTAAALLDLGANPSDGSLYMAIDMHDATTDMFTNDPTRLRPDNDNELTAMDLIERLVAAGADPNGSFSGAMHSVSNCCAPTMSGTPVFRAAQAADVAALRLLVAAGGDPNQMPPAGGGGGRGGPPPGQTALMLAMSGGNGPARGGGPGTNTRDAGPPFREAADRDPIEATRILIDAGADVNATTPQGDTPLHLAAQDGKVEIIQMLADAGATLDAVNEAGLTPLDLASGKRPPPANDGGRGGGGGRGRGGGPPQPQVDAIILLQELQGLPVQLPELPQREASQGENE